MTNNNGKITKIQVLAALAEALSVPTPTEEGYAIAVDAELYNALIAYTDNEITLLKSKAERAKSVQTKAKKENEELRKILVSVLKTADKPMSIKQIMTSDPRLDTSCQKIASLMSPLIRDEDNPAGIIIRTLEKKITYYTIADDESGDYNF